MRASASFGPETCTIVGAVLQNSSRMLLLLSISLVVAACATSSDAILPPASASEPLTGGRRELPPAADFPSAYRKAHRGATRVAIPEVYELVNVAIALTATAEADSGLVHKESAYYQDVLRHFATMRNHPFVLALDREMKAESVRYFSLKMNAYAFEYDHRGRVTPS